jgi:BirA family biotin operon repressor/biotin-[acetyl-CoA-carboxylase] ligase
MAEATSTNDLARLLATAGAPEGAVVVADLQTHGRGRLGRAWASPVGGLWCSILLRPAGANVWGRLSMSMAVAVAEAVEAETGARLDIGWPNDLIAADRKVCGILIEAGFGGAVIVGIGLNVSVDVRRLPPDVAARAASLHVLTGRSHDRRQLLGAVLGRVGHWYGRWREGSLGVLDAWAARDIMRGTRVAIGAGATRVEGVADGVGDDGALLVRRDDGAITRVVAGDLHPGAAQ